MAERLPKNRVKNKDENLMRKLGLSVRLEMTLKLIAVDGLGELGNVGASACVVLIGNIAAYPDYCCDVGSNSIAGRFDQWMETLTASDSLTQDE